MPNTPAADESGPATIIGLDDAATVATTSPSKRNRTRARWLMRIAVLALIVSNLALVWHDRALLITQTRVSNTNLARAVSERIEGMLLEVDHLTATLAEQMEPMSTTLDGLSGLQGAIVSVVARTAQLDAIFVYGAQSDLVLSSEAAGGTLLQEDKGVYFGLHSTSASTAAVLWAPSSTGAGGHGWRLPMTRRLVDQDGNFSGVLVASVSIENMRKLLDRFDISEGAITVTASGKHLVRRPYLPEEVGKALNGPPGFLSANAGSGDSRSPLDGVERLYSFEKTQSYPVRVIVAASKSEVLRGWWIASTLQTIWVCLLCLVLKRSSDHARAALRVRQEAERSLRKAHQSLASANQRLSQMAQYDELTKLPNRRYFDRRFERMFKQAQRDQSWLSLVMVDVDQFKTYNDRYGHPAGDRCLAMVAAALRGATGRPEDFVARYGGEEMIMLLPMTDSNGAYQVAEKARRAILACGIPHGESPLKQVSASFGVAAWKVDGSKPPSAMLEEADQALYAAKAAGRNKVVIHPAQSQRVAQWH